MSGRNTNFITVLVSQQNQASPECGRSAGEATLRTLKKSWNWIESTCRYEHFVRCIESLKRNTWAKYTDVYVALDYPWVVSSGGWIQQSGVIGTIIAFLLGGIMIYFVGLVYAELTTALPENGGAKVFSQHAFGTIGSFICTWSIILSYIGVRRKHGLSSSPRLCTSFRQSSRDVVDILESVVHSDIMRSANGGNTVTDGLFELLLDILSDDKYYMVESSLNCIMPQLHHFVKVLGSMLHL